LNHYFAQKYEVCCPMKTHIIIVWVILTLSQCTTNNTSHTAQQAGIALSFDDRFIEEWFQLRPLLLQYHTKATFYITQPDSLSPREIMLLKILEKDGHEIGCHGAQHIRSLPFVWQNSLAEYMQVEIFPALATMKKQGFSPITFAHPGGSQFWWIDLTLLKHFVLLRDVSLKERKLYGFSYHRNIEQINEIYYDFKGQKRVEALLIDESNQLTWQELRWALVKAQKTNTALMLFGHRPLSASNRLGTDYGFDIKRLEQILAESAKLGLKSYTMAELVQP
jgi:hypothetical protein